jgi:hypothetical protein
MYHVTKVTVIQCRHAQLTGNPVVSGYTGMDTVDHRQALLAMIDF